MLGPSSSCTVDANRPSTLGSTTESLTVTIASMRVLPTTSIEGSSGDNLIIGRIEQLQKQVAFGSDLGRRRRQGGGPASGRPSVPVSRLLRALARAVPSRSGLQLWLVAAFG